MSTATLLLRSITAACERRGLAVAPLVAGVGLSIDALASPDARVPTDRYLALFEAAAEIGGPDFGLDVARALDAAAFGLAGFLVASSDTLREALLRFSRYTRLLCDELEVTVTERSDRVVVAYTMLAATRVPALFEMALSHLVNSSRLGTGGAFRPERVCFRHSSRSPALPSFVGSPVEYDADEDSVICDPRSLALPLKGANPALLSVLERHAELVLDGLPRDPELVVRCREAVRRALPDGEPALELVARRLGLGARTLQRRLRELGTSYRGLVDDVRRDAALRELADPAVSIAEVAFSLGFADPSAFHHAFRRWTGRSPRGRA